MDKKLHETTTLCVEIMNSKLQVKGRLGHVVQILVCRFFGRLVTWYKFWSAFFFGHVVQILVCRLT